MTPATNSFAVRIGGPKQRLALVVLLRACVGGVLIVAGLLKLSDPSTFATEIANYQLWPAISPLLAATLPMTELLVGAAILAFPPRWRRPAEAAALLLLAMFFSAVTVAYLRGIDISCGCFGGGGSAISLLTLLRNALLIASAVVLIWLDRAPTPMK